MSTLQTPLISSGLEQLRERLRERRAVTDDLLKLLANSSATSSPLLLPLDTTTMDFVRKLHRLHTKLTQCTVNESACFDAMSARIRFSHECDAVMMKSNSNSNSNSNNNGGGGGVSGVVRRREGVFLADYLARCGYYETAKMLAKQRDVVDLVDVEIFASIASILSSLKRGDTKPALEWCHRNRSKLKKINSRLEFELRRQELIELCRSGHEDLGQRSANAGDADAGLLGETESSDILANAVAYAKKHLSKFAKSDDGEGDDAFKGLQEAMALVIFGPTTSITKYRSLYSLSRYSYLSSLLTSSLCTIYSLPSTSLLLINLQAGLAALKTRGDFEDRSVEDPMRVPEFEVLSRELPFARHNNSKLICHVTRRRIDEDNPPMVLPNGYVYSKMGIDVLSAKAKAKGMKGIVCPRTGDGPYDEKKDIVKAFIS